MQDANSLAEALADRYRLERELGQGGMATVWLAHDLRHGRDVALKVLRPDLAAILGAQRFLNEVRITARLDHPHILTLIDSGESAGFLWYVVPWIRGESLRARLEREKQLSVADALAITRHVAAALEYAHRQGVIHRDIKPENILLHEGEAMLADFGIALAVREAGGNRLTETGISLGTPQYMSPEQATGNREVDARSDLYSLAAVLYEMLAGEPPLTGATVQAVIARLLTERPTPLRVLRDAVPEAVDAAVARALSKLPVDRQPSVAGFVEALSAPATPGRAAEPLRHPSSRRPAVLLLGGLVGLTALALGAVAILRRPAERVVQPDRVQLTFTGNARTPALSADGLRLAYSTRQCDPEGNCTAEIVLQDLGGAGSTSILGGWASVGRLEWTGDGRYLLVTGFEGAGGNWGVHSVSTLGGRPRFLSRGDGALLGSSDTAVVAYQVAGDSVAWVRMITLSDGVVRDSLAAPAAGYTMRAVPSPDGRWVLVLQNDRQGWTALIVDRAGRPLDSLRFTDPGLLPRFITLTRDGRALLVPQGLPFRTGQGPFDLIAYRVSRGGRIAPRPDTILRGLEGHPTLSPDGALLLTEGPVRFQVWALERPSAVAMEFTQRQLAAATSELRGEVSPAGDQVLLQRTAMVDGAPRSRFSVLPFEGGPEAPLDAPPDLLGANWNWSGDRVRLFHFSHPDSVAIRELDPATGRLRPAEAVFWRLVAAPPVQRPGGGLLVPQNGPAMLRRVGVPGRPDTAFTLPAEYGSIMGIAPSPDGRAAAVIGWDRQGDSLLVARLSLVDGSVTRLASFYPEGTGQPAWLADGTLIIPIVETEATLAWYRIPAGGGPVVRLGSPPRYPADYSLSSDGRRVVANTSEDSPDIYLIRNFALLLRH
jgi:hypothetical protein